MQIGGRRGQPVQVATHAVRAFQSANLNGRRPCAILFVDLREAFHRVVRPLIYGGTLSDHHVAGIVKELGLGPETIPRLHEYARSQSLIAEAGATQWASHMMKEISDDSWFTFGINGDFACVQGGTRPGDNLADLVFTFLFAEVSRRIRQAFSDNDIVSDIPWSPGWMRSCSKMPHQPSEKVLPVDVTWMDDMSILLQASTASRLLHRLRIAATLTVDECLKAILLLNLRAGKISLVGRGARNVARTAFEGKEPTLQLDSGIWPDARLRLTAAYKHLGGIVQVGGGLKKELKARMGSAWQAFNKHKRLIFGSPTVQPGEKAVLFSSLVESTIYYGSGTWPELAPAEADRLQGCLLRMARQMLRPRMTFEEACHASGKYVMAQARIVSAATSVHVDRLRHFKALVLKATKEIWAILHYEERWILLMQESLSWFRYQHALSGTCQEDWETWEGVVEFIRHVPHKWKKAVNRAKQTAALRELWESERQQHFGLLFRSLSTADRNC